MLTTNSMFDLYAIFLTFTLYFSGRSRRKTSETNNIFSRLLLVIVALLFSDALGWHLNKHPQLFLQKFLFFLIYTLTLLLLLWYDEYLKAFWKENYGIDFKGWKKYSLAVFSIMEALWIISLFNGMFYSFGEDGSIHYTALFPVTQIGAAFIMIPAYTFIFRSWKRLGSKNSLIWLSFLVVPVLIRYVDMKYNTPFFFPTLALNTLLVYTLINEDMERKIKSQRMEIQEAQEKIMVSQIQPHFLYNVLNTICVLCRKDPGLAAETTADFATYLRMNLNSLSKREPVFFAEELSHVENYLKLEKRRFGEDLNYVFDIKSQGFMLPVLTLQPIVENAVKHGVCQKDDGGTVWIRTYEDEANYYVEVEDDGVGFDVSKPFLPDGKSHIGMKHTIDRIQSQCNGTVHFESTLGKGTLVKITIPKRKRQAF